MFKTSINGKDFLLFRDAPPKTRFDGDQPDTKRPERPNDIKDIQWSVFYYWWAYLRLNDQYLACCQNGGKGPLSSLYRSFGDIWLGDYQSARKPAAECLDIFEKWWGNIGVGIFKEAIFMPPEILTDEYPPEVVLKFKSHAVIWVWLDTDIDFMMQEIRKILAPKIQEFRGTEWENEFPYFRVHGNYQLKALDSTLKIAETYHFLKQNDDEKPDHLEIFDKANAGIKPRSGAISSKDQQWRRKQVSEALKRANNLISNIGEGRFPDYSEPQRGSFIFYLTRTRTTRDKKTKLSD